MHRETHVTARRTLLKPGRERDYDSLHAAIPAVLAIRFGRAGVTSWMIWRDGRSLFHVIESTKPLDVALAELAADDEGANDPELVDWDLRVGALLEQYHEGDLPLIWSLTEQQ